MIKKKEKIITFGEIMLRLSTPDHQTINQTHSYLANYGGGEANVAVALSHMGHNCYFMSKLPPNQLGDGAISHLNANGVHTDYIVRGSTTLGIYFLESGFGGRPSKVIYNRKHSAITRISLDEFDLEEVFEGATWFHVSGISLALNERVAEVAVACCKYCHEHDIKVSFDFNYRTKLWTVEEAKPWYQQIIKYVDVAFCSFWDCNTLLDIPLDENLNDASMHEKRKNVCPKMMKKFGVTYVFGTDRVVYSATENSLAGYYYTQEGCGVTDPIRFQILDRIGGGDAFASGVIHGLIKDYNNPKYAAEFGLNTSVLKHTIYGDACLLSQEDIEAFMKCNGSAEVQR